MKKIHERAASWHNFKPQEVVELILITKSKKKNNEYINVASGGEIIKVWNSHIYVLTIVDISVWIYAPSAVIIF